MKYFVVLILLLMTVAYKIAHLNDEALEKAESAQIREPLERKIAKINLNKVSVNNPKLVEYKDSNVDLSDTHPSYYDQEFAEGNHELLESRYSMDAEEKYKPESNNEHTKNLIEDIKKEI